jgi:peptide/nickel transport system permease protein
MRFVIVRTVRTAVVLFAVSLTTFLLTSLLPGDPAFSILGLSATDQAVAQIRHDMQLNKPIPERYVSWLGHVVQGDLGRSYLTQRVVTDSLKSALPVSLTLILYAQLMGLLIGVPLAIACAYYEGGWLDRVSTVGSFGAIAIPNFIVGVFLVYLFAFKLGWFNPQGYTPLSQSVIGNARSMFLPALTLAIGEIAVYSRVLRTDMILTLKEDFILMARAKGLPTWRILIRHALKPSSFTLLTVATLNIAGLISGAVLIETIFNLPGLGRLTVQSVTSRDYILVQGCVLVIACAFVLANFVADLAYGLLDPRVRRAGNAA